MNHLACHRQVSVVRHSAATKAVVSIKRGTQRLRIAIEDNGKGFDPGAPPPHRDVRGGGFGLLGLTERVRMLKGAHRIESAAGAGTKIVININFDEARKNENERNN